MSINSFGPLDSEVWGTVSDWFIVLLTSLTAVFLIRTFNSQKKILKLQYDLNYHEHLKYKISIRPHFKLDCKNKNVLIDDWYKKSFDLDLSFSITNGQRVENMKPQIIQNDKNWDYKEYIGTPIPSFEPHHNLSYKLKYNNVNNMDLNGIKALFIRLNFTDVIMNNYRQDFKFTIENNKPQFIEYQPEEIRS